MSPPPNKILQQNDRRIEVIANVLPLWDGVNVAVDTTLVSPSTAKGEPRRQGRRSAGALPGLPAKELT